MRLVQVTWQDAHAVGETWAEPDDLAIGYRVVSVGLQLDGEPGYTVIAQSLGEDGKVDHVLAIPAGMITSIVELVPR